MNCFNCEVSKSCQDCLSKVTRTAEYSVEINKLKRQPENEFGHMLPYYETENNIVIYKPVQKPIKRCSKCETELNTEKYIKNKTICRACHNEKLRKRRNTDFSYFLGLIMIYCMVLESWSKQPVFSSSFSVCSKCSILSK